MAKSYHFRLASNGDRDAFLLMLEPYAKGHATVTTLKSGGVMVSVADRKVAVAVEGDRFRWPDALPVTMASKAEVAEAAALVEAANMKLMAKDGEIEYLKKQLAEAKKKKGGKSAVVTAVKETMADTATSDVMGASVLAYNLLCEIAGKFTASEPISVNEIMPIRNELGRALQAALPEPGDMHKLLLAAKKKATLAGDTGDDDRVLVLLRASRKASQLLTDLGAGAKHNKALNRARTGLAQAIAAFGGKPIPLPPDGPEVSDIDAAVAEADWRLLETAKRLEGSALDEEAYSVKLVRSMLLSASTNASGGSRVKVKDRMGAVDLR